MRSRVSFEVLQNNTRRSEEFCQLLQPTLGRTEFASPPSGISELNSSLPEDLEQRHPGGISVRHALL